MTKLFPQGTSPSAVCESWRLEAGRRNCIARCYFVRTPLQGQTTDLGLVCEELLSLNLQDESTNPSSLPQSQ